MTFGNRLRMIIKEEQYSQAQFAQEIKVSRSTIERYLADKQEPAGGILLKIVNNDRFKKYALWLMTGEVESGIQQIAPHHTLEGNKFPF